MPEHWKHRATRCAVVGCQRQRNKGWSTCSLTTHFARGKSLYGAGHIDPITLDDEPLPRRFCTCHPNATKTCVECAGRGYTTPNPAVVTCEGCG